MKDNFSTQSDDYSKFRPQYPDEMIDYIVSFVDNTTTALDVATGNGQIAHKLSRHFKMVYATDISENQLENAICAANIIYKKERAESTSFDANLFDLIVVAQAIHWFDFAKFYGVVRRIAKPGCILAVIGYGVFSTNEDSDRILMDFYHNIVGPYWDPERRYLDEKYETIPFPFTEVDSKQFTNELHWTFDQLTGYLNTWSATQHYKNKHQSNPVDLIYEELRESWERCDKVVCFPLLLRLGKI